MTDDLFRRAVESPLEVDDAVLAEWIEEASEVIGHDRDQAKALRRVVRLAKKLAAYHGSRKASLPDWRNGVDEALGVRGWEPQLDLVRNELETAPSEALFSETKVRHRAVHFSEWMEGVGFEEWRAGRT